MIQGLSIVIYEKVYSSLAYMLTNFENHKTYSMYEGSLITKNFTFQFFNYMNSLFYIAFFKRNRLGCLYEDENGDEQIGSQGICSGELRRQLFVNMLVLIGKNLIEIGMPLI